MKLGHAVARLQRAQETLAFKIAASAVILALAITSFAAYTVAATAPALSAANAPPSAAAPAPADDPELAALQREQRNAIEAGARLVQDVLSARRDPLNVGIAIAAVSGVALTVVWLGVGLTYLALALVVFFIAYPLWLLGQSPQMGRIYIGVEPDRIPLARVLNVGTRLLVGIVALTASFTAILQGLRVLLSASHPVTAIARNVLAEAVRMKISLVFIVLLIFGMAALPGLLNDGSPLRYRVQAFLQYGTGGSFWLIALLTLFFAAATVSFEQRDRQIWQTMTKPVSAWQYLLGKWVGVMALNAALLTVCCSGIFLFTEYLRQQPAYGEATLATTGQQRLSEDRILLETQVLAARVQVEPVPPLAQDDPEFVQLVRSYIENARRTDADFARDPATVRHVTSDLYKGYIQQYRAVEPGGQEVFIFDGLRSARRSNQPLTLRYRVDAAGNRPDLVFTVSFSLFQGGPWIVRQTALGQGHVVQLAPFIVDRDQRIILFEDPDFQAVLARGLGPTERLFQAGDVIDDEGRLAVVIVNGGIMRTPVGGWQLVPNPETISLPPNSLYLSYSAGSYRANFLRVALLLWIKLGFLAILGITAATFLSFPVACLVAIGAFFAAESGSYLRTALETYGSTNHDGSTNYFKVIAQYVSAAVVWMFRTYSQLKPTARLVDGRLVTWTGVASAAGILMLWSAGLFALGGAVFRRRELATYSGQF